MKKILLVIVSYLAFVGVLCLLVAFAVGHVPAVLPGQEKHYVGVRALLFFLKALPAVFCTGFLVACALYFGHHAGNAQMRFSAAIMTHFKTVLITSLAMVFVLALAREIAIPQLTAQQKLAVEAPELLNEYLISGRYCIVIKSYVLAHEYAKQALKLDPTNKDAQALLDDAERNMNRMKPRAQSTEALTTTFYSAGELENETVTSLIKKAQAAMQQTQWFYAHYYAQLALALGNGSDINMQEARLLSAEAWNHLNDASSLTDYEAKQFYESKKRAYSYLMSGDNLEAYYAFLELEHASSAGLGDPDVQNFFAIAKERLANEAFFIDETLHLQLFESIQNIYFTITHADGARDMVFVKGITNVSNSGRMIQYLREFTLYAYSPTGKFLYSVTTPYAKMIAEPISVFDAETAGKLGLQESYKTVPYVILKSVAREVGRMKNEPLYTYADDISPDERTAPSAMVLAIPFEDFTIVCDSAVGPKNMNLLSLIKLAPKADSFGYAAEVVEAALISRLTYPLMMLIVFILCACFAWNYRLGETQLFKFVWAFALPLATVVLYALLEIGIYTQEVICYALIGIAGQYALVVTVVLYILLLFLAATYFMTRKA